MSAARPALPCLTALRGIAALLVVVYHFDSLLGFQQLGPLVHGTGLLARGYLWVDFFFVLSGFIITHVYGDTFAHGVRKPDVRAFFAARFARIWPLHAFALTLTVALFVGVFSRLAGPMDMSKIYPWRELPLHYLLLLSFGLTSLGWNVPAWSIGAEWWTYLLALPAFRLLHRGISKRTFVTPVVCCVGLWLLMRLTPYRSLDITFDYGLIRCVLSFTVGVCLYQLHRANVGGARLSADGAFYGALIATALLLHYPEPPPRLPSGELIVPPATPYVDALSPLVFSALILTAARNAGRVRDALESRPLKGLGEISYSVYLMQGMAFPVIFGGAGAWKAQHPNAPLPVAWTLGLLLGMVGIDLLLAMGTYRWVEVPARRWLRTRLGQSAQTRI